MVTDRTRTSAIGMAVGGALAAAALYVYKYYWISPLTVEFTEEGLQLLSGNEHLLSLKEQEIVDRLLRLGQGHLFVNWPPPGLNDADKKRMVQQVNWASPGLNANKKWIVQQIDWPLPSLDDAYKRRMVQLVRDKAFQEYCYHFAAL